MLLIRRLFRRQDVQLLEKVQKKYFAKCAETVNEDDADTGVAPLIEAVVSGDWLGVAERCDPSRNWKEALAAALTYAYHDPQVRMRHHKLHSELTRYSEYCP